jgi:hypothetical protein
MQTRGLSLSDCGVDVFVLKIQMPLQSSTVAPFKDALPHFCVCYNKGATQMTLGVSVTPE